MFFKFPAHFVFVLICQSLSNSTADFCQNSLYTIFPFFARFARNLIKRDFLRWFSNIVILLRLAFASLLCMCNFGNKFGRRRRETMRTKCWLYNNTSTAKLLLLWTKEESKKKKELEKRAAKKALSSFYSIVITYHSCWLVSFLLFTPT